ncbi:MAG: Fe-S-containing hydro-lyase [Clostridia bacterium]
MKIELTTPLNRETLSHLNAGDIVSISGTIFAARDAAHKKMIALLEEGKELPFDVRNQVVYYVGPCPEKPGQIIGSAGPTTSGRMDAYAPKLIEMGLLGMIGKGERSAAVKKSILDFGAVYFGCTGGAGALLSKSIVSQEIIAFEELGPEALRKLVVKDFPAIVVLDAHGKNLYEIGRNKFEKLK